MATRVDYANGIDATDIGTIYLTGAGYVNYPFRGASRESALGWEEPVWGAELNRSIDLVMDNIDDVEYGLVARCEISYKYLNVQDYRVLCKIAKQKVCIANFFNRETGERVTQEMAFTGNEIGKLYKFGTDYLGVIDMAIKLVATNRDRVDMISATHTITYNSNGGSGTIAQQSVGWAKQQKLADSGFTKSGSTLLGWSTRTDGKGEQYILGQQLTVFGDLLLYANWSVDIILPSGQNLNVYIKGTGSFTTENQIVEEIIFDNFTSDNEYAPSGTNLISGLQPERDIGENQALAKLYRSSDGKKVFILAPENVKLKTGTDCSNMFRNFTALKTIRFNNFDSSDAENMAQMFYGCYNITNINLDKLKTQNVTNMGATFSGFGRDSLKAPDVSNFDTSKVTSMMWMFSGCKCENINISSFKFNSVTNASGIFLNCTNLQSLNFTNYDFSAATTVNSMFSGCSSLRTIYSAGNFILSNSVNSTDMFNGCTSLVGGNGTAYNSTIIDKTYARIDVLGTPGYLTQA